MDALELLLDEEEELDDEDPELSDEELGDSLDSESSPLDVVVVVVSLDDDEVFESADEADVAVPPSLDDEEELLSGAVPVELDDELLCDSPDDAELADDSLVGGVSEELDDELVSCPLELDDEWLPGVDPEELDELVGDPPDDAELAEDSLVGGVAEELDELFAGSWELADESLTGVVADESEDGTSSEELLECVPVFEEVWDVVLDEEVGFVDELLVLDMGCDQENGLETHTVTAGRVLQFIAVHGTSTP